MYGIINIFEIDWSSIAGGEKWLMTMLPNIIAEIYSEGGVAEQFYDDCNFPLDKDHNEDIWKK